MKLPKKIRKYLDAEFIKSRRPFCFKIGGDYELQRWWGDDASHGFAALRAGEKMLERAPYLFGLLGSETEVLPFVTTVSGGIVEVHVIPGQAAYHVVVMDAGEEHEFHRRRQQTANELKLLHANQHKLITRQRTLISELIEAKAELDHRRREAERNNTNKNQFIAMMSHEFRTPLSSIINYADLALEDGTSEADLRKSAEAIARASRHLHSLVNTVLDEARLEAGHLKLSERTFEVRTLFDDLSTIMAPLAAEKGLSFATYLADRVPDMLRADDVCLRQILINLLGNAVKFTESGGVRVDVDWLEAQLHVTVSDTGPGIDSSDQERIFSAYERGSDADRAGQSGTGLGLAITLQLARLMKGQVDLHSQPGEGVRVSVCVPAVVVENHLQDESVLPIPAEEYNAKRTATILLCDDDEDLLTLAEYYLHRAGYGLLLARNGEEAVEKALSYRPDMVIMDINTPRLSGSDAAARLRQAGFSEPIVALTASDIRKLDKKDFTDSLRKPIQMPRLLARIRKYID